VEKVVLESGHELRADLVVAGIGVEPVVDIFRDTDVRVDNGIVVNEYLETGINAIYAAGDVANYYDVLFQKQRRTEHWDNAVSQGQHVAHVLSGKREPFVHVPYFFSDEFDLSYEFWGDTEGADQIAYRGQVEKGTFSVWWLREGCVRAAFVLNRPDEEREMAPKWIEECKRVDRTQLVNEGLSLSEVGTGIFH
jgi:NADPH-dependent 2,4-dienoyl-CoA reductase/sulfur reductase-like enzyme